MSRKVKRTWAIALALVLVFLFGVGFELGSKEAYAGLGCCSCYAQLDCPVTCVMGGKLVGSECELCDPPPPPYGLPPCTLCRCE